MGFLRPPAAPGPGGAPPGAGFDPAGEGYFRLSAFTAQQAADKAIARIQRAFVRG